MFIIHTANLFLDKPFSSFSNPNYGRERREKQLEVLSDIINKVLEYKADALLIAGNLLDSEYATDETLHILYEKFKSIQPIPIIISPGTADPIHTYSPYYLEDFPENVFIANQSNWVKWESTEIPLVVYTSAICNETNNPAVPFPDLPEKNDGRNHIILAHQFPFIEECQQNKEFARLQATVSYVALGKGQEYMELYRSPQYTACYCGFPEPICFDNKPPFGVLGIHFQQHDNKWEVSKIEHLITQKTYYSHIELNISNILDRDELTQILSNEIGKIQKPRIVHIQFIGTVSANVLKTIPSAVQIVEKECESFTWNIEADFEEYMDIKDEQQFTILSEFFKQIQQELKYAPNHTIYKIINRARHLTAESALEIKLMIPTIETNEVPFQWNS
ncbi:MAG TPA: hypothetical protein PLX23_01025 [Candidatus Hydrogenedens sp.]|nr:hypothetical protein [Candidatus Hydrogenedens sp.]